MNLKKYISVFLVFFLLISSIPEYAVLAYSESKNKEILKANEATNSPTENLKEITNKRTPYTKTFKDEKGDFYKEIYAEPIHSKQGKEYGEIDDTLIPENEIISTENTDLKANFPKRIKDDQSIIYKKDGHRIEFEITSASQKGKGITPNLASKTDLEDNKVQYNDIYPKVDLRHITFNDEVKEDWIVNEYTGIHQFVYTLKTDLKPMSQKDGSIVFFSKEDISNAVFTLPKPMMMDSNISEQKGEGVYSDQLKYILKRVKDDTYTLTLDADDEWLKSEKRVYPVYIDPSVSIDALGDTYISSKYPKSNFNKEWDPAQGEYILKTGYYDSSTGTNYSFIKFSVVGDLKGATIESADLQAFVTHAYYAGKKNGLWVDEVKGAWGANDLTWNNKPSSTKITSTSVGRDEWAHFNVKDTIQAWVSGERSNYGFKFHTNGNGQTYWKKITAAESAKKAKIVVKYHYDQMPAPTVTATADNVTAKTGSVNVKWKSVYGATSYKLQMYDGARYETVYTGSALNWTSKGRKIFPKAPYNSNSRYSLDGKGTELPYDPSKFYSATLGSSTTTNLYKFRVVPVYPTGDGPVSNIVSKAIPIPAGEPDIPTVTTGTYGETDTANSGRGWLNIKWNKVANATGYKVRIWNGSSYKNYSVGKDTTSISTKGKKLWPTDTQIKAGIKDLQDVSLEGNSVGKGAELPIDPSKTYGNSSTRYSVRVIATSAAGDSPSSDVNYGYMKLYAPKNVKITANEDNLVQNKTSLTFDWKASTGARYYEIQLNDGKTTEKFKVKGNTTYTTKKANYALNKKYTATVTAFFEDDDTAPDTEENKISGQRGLSDKSSVATLQPNLHEELIGLEDYFTYDESEFGNTSSYVNVTTGNMSLQFTDESLYTRSDLDYNFIRTYNSRSEKVSALGKGWTFAGNESLTRTGNGDILYEDEDGTVHTFKMKTEDTFISPKGRYEKLKKQNDIYTLTSKDGFVKTYKLSQTKDTYVLVSYTDSYNNKIDFKRNEKGQIIEIEEIKAASNHENIRISYTNDKISKVQYGDYWITYDYMAESLVKTTKGNVKTNRTITENFVYDTNGQLIKYTDGKK
ncbi:DNRLRE domain-containing protein [Bacillus altitudinis]|nr:DNRLRE domain-containing protein [Bacillus altitudinis]